MGTIALVDRDPTFERRLRAALRPHAIARCAGWPETGDVDLVVWNLDARPAEPTDLMALAAGGPGLMVVWDGEAQGPAIAAALRAGAVDARSKLGGIEPLAAAAEAYLRRHAAPVACDDVRMLARVHELLAGMATCTDLAALRAQVMPPLLALTGADAGWLCVAGLEGGDGLPPGQAVAAERLRREFGADPGLRWHLRGDGYLARGALAAGSEAVGELWLVGEAVRLDRLGAAAPLVRAITGQLGLAIAYIASLDETRQRAERDGLTRLANHAHLRRELYAEHERVRRYGGAFVLLLLDVDRLEAVNAAHGRPAGDAVLQAVAGLLDAGRRSCDLAARRGGGEFALLLPHTDAAGARRIAQRLEAEVRALDVRGTDGEPLGPLSATAGFACASQEDVDALALLARAEEALRLAKAEGDAVDLAVAAVPARQADVLPDELGAAPEAALRLPAAPSVAARATGEASAVVAREFERLKADFLSTASHELRTPLSAILGYAELLQDALVGPLNGEQTEFVAQIESNAQRLVVLVEAMLDAARHEHAPIDLVRADVDLGDLCAELTAALEPAARRSRIALAFNRPKGAMTIRVDARRVRQAVATLVENAIKFTPEGGRVEVRLTRAGDQARVAVSDDGIGIPPAVQGQLFQKFYQVDGGPTRMRNGAGLGLYVAKAIVEAHGGVVGVQSAYGEGSTFWLTLPGVAAPVA